MNLGNSSLDGPGPLSEINITPFVDVMLVLLVIFMVATPLMEQGIPVELPKASAKAMPKDHEKPVILSLTKDSKLFLDRQEVLLSALQPMLRKIAEKKKDREVYIRADGSLRYALVAQTMAAVKLSGLTRIGLITEPPDSERNK